MNNNSKEINNKIMLISYTQRLMKVSIEEMNGQDKSNNNNKHNNKFHMK